MVYGSGFQWADVTELQLDAEHGCSRFSHRELSLSSLRLHHITLLLHSYVITLPTRFRIIESLTLLNSSADKTSDEKSKLKSMVSDEKDNKAHNKGTLSSQINSVPNKRHMWCPGNWPRHLDSFFPTLGSKSLHSYQIRKRIFVGVREITHIK